MKRLLACRSIAGFVVNTLDLEAKSDRPPRLAAILADRYKLSGLGLSPAVHAQLDSMYDANRNPKLSQMIDLAGLGLAESAHAQLDSMYADPKEISASQKAAWLGLELSPAALVELDSYEDHHMTFGMGDTTRDRYGGREVDLTYTIGKNQRVVRIPKQSLAIGKG